jgi:hypothetical protein
MMKFQILSEFNEIMRERYKLIARLTYHIETLTHYSFQIQIEEVITHY